jgi:hypothetical protein
MPQAVGSYRQYLVYRHATKVRDLCNDAANSCNALMTIGTSEPCIASQFKTACSGSKNE